MPLFHPAIGPKVWYPQLCYSTLSSKDLYIQSHPRTPFPKVTAASLQRKSQRLGERLSCLGDEGGPKDREARSPQEVGGVGGILPIPLSSSSCSHNALGQECKRQLSPQSTEAAAEQAELWRVPQYQRRIRTTAWCLVPWGSRNRTQGPGIPGCHSPPPPLWGTAGPLFTRVTFMPIPDESSEPDRARREEPRAEIQRQAGDGAGGDRQEHKAGGKQSWLRSMGTGPREEVSGNHPLTPRQ